MNDPPRLSLVVPTRGDDTLLMRLAAALERQTLPGDRWERIVVFDGVAASPAVRARLQALGAEIVELSRRSGPGAARNAGAMRARGEYLVLSEDDVTPEPEWLARALARLDAEPALDVLEGATMKPGGRPVRKLAADRLAWLPTNLFVRRSLFEKVGGYADGYFDAGRGLYFREDSDFGFTLEQAGARIARAPDAIVVHPDEHARYLDPLRWARRYEMDALLASRYPELFRERIEVHRVGPFTIRRPIVRASLAFVLALLAAATSAVAHRGGLAVSFLGLAALAFLPIWAKWRFDPLRLPVIVLVPFVLIGALIGGRARARAFSRRSRPGTPART